MSFHRENVIWESKGGKYYRGFFATLWVGSEADGYDPEWDVDYDYDNFNNIAGPFYSQQEAYDSWQGANPGSYEVAPYIKENAELINQYDMMFRKAKEAEQNYRNQHQTNRTRLYNPYHQVSWR